MRPDRQSPRAETPEAPLRPHPLLERYYSDEAQRRRQVLAWFDESAVDYDWVTQALSFGSGVRYRREALLRAGLAPGMAALDVACGTGVLAKHAQDIVGADGANGRTIGQAIGLDLSTGMLRQAAARGVRRLVRGRAEALPFPDERFDLLSMGYALRHVNDLRTTFREYRRVLRPGGRALILEITPPRRRLPFWLLKIKSGKGLKFDVPNGESRRLELSAKDIERAGPALLLDEDTAKSRLLVWTE